MDSIFIIELFIDLNFPLDLIHIMSKSDENLSSIIENATMKYNEYAQTQKDFQIPEAHISIEEESDQTTKVFIEVKYKDIEYQFRSIEERDVNDVYQYLNSQAAVRSLYSAGNTISLEATTKRVNTLAQRFRQKNSPTYLYSGFIVSDLQTEMFLGLANIGVGPAAGISEMAFLNRVECWSRSINANDTAQKLYSGVGTVETCTLLQYATRLKEKGYQIEGHPLKAVVAFSRIDNEGSWKACAKAGMILSDVEVVSQYGNNLRYHLRKDILES